MATKFGGAWYVPAKSSSYSVIGFILALLGGALLAGAADLGGQAALAYLSGQAPETVLQKLAGYAVNPAAIADPQQLLIIGGGVQFAIALVLTLIYVVAAWRSPLVNSTPELSILTYGLVIGYALVWLVPMALQAGALPSLNAGNIITTFLRSIFLIATPIALVAKLTARESD